MDTALSIAVGIGLSAACGFRVFVPLLIMSIASLTGHLSLSSGFTWIGTYTALFVFSTATIVEIAAYFIPWLDHALDVVASPAAVVAGTIVSASVVTDIPPYLQWTLALIAGGGIAGVVQGSTVLIRAKSSAFTGGLANPLVSSGELVGAIATSVLALLAPFICAILLALSITYVLRRFGCFIFGRRNLT